MENLKSFEEYMYRNPIETKPERYEKSKEWFILKLVTKGHTKEELKDKTIADLGKMWSIEKNK